MLFGCALRSAQNAQGQFRSLPKRLLALVAGCLLTIAVLWNWNDPHDTFDALIDASLRIDSHPLYFSVGALGALTLSCGFILFNDVRHFRLGHSLRVFGRRSLFAFGIGNILAYIAPPALADRFGVWASVVALFSLVCILTLLYDQIERTRWFSLARLTDWFRHLKTAYL